MIVCEALVLDLPAIYQQKVVQCHVIGFLFQVLLFETSLHQDIKKAVQIIIVELLYVVKCIVP